MKQHSPGTPQGDRDLEEALQSLKCTESRARFLWRSGINAIAWGQAQRLDDILNRYGDLTGAALIASANTDMVRTFGYLQRREYEKAEQSAQKYREKQQRVWKRTEIPDPGIQGILTGLYMETIVALSMPWTRPDQQQALREFLPSIARLQGQVGVGPLADGLRDIGAMSKIVIPEVGVSFSPSNRRRIKIRKGRKDDLTLICRDLDELLGRRRASR